MKKKVIIWQKGPQLKKFEKLCPRILFQNLVFNDPFQDHFSKNFIIVVCSSDPVLDSSPPFRKGCPRITFDNKAPLVSNWRYELRQRQIFFFRSKLKSRWIIGKPNGNRNDNFKYKTDIHTVTKCTNENDNISFFLDHLLDASDRIEPHRNCTFSIIC